MKFLITLLSLAIGLTVPSVTLGQQVLLPKKQVVNSGVTISNLNWAYARPDNPAEAYISIANNSDKMIRSVRILVLTKDENGIILQNFGSTLRQLINSDTIGIGQVKKLHFKSPFDNQKIATVELKQATIEYENGALEILRK